MEGGFYALLIGRGLCGGPQIGMMNKISKSGAAAFLAHFLPVFGSGFGVLGLALGLGLGVGLGLRPCLYPTRVCFLLANARTAPRPKDPGAQLVRSAPKRGTKYVLLDQLLWDFS